MATCIEARLIQDRLLKDIAGPVLDYQVLQNGTFNALKAAGNQPGLMKVDVDRMDILPPADGSGCKYQIHYTPPECGESLECGDDDGDPWAGGSTPGDWCPTQTNKDRQEECTTPEMGPCIQDGFKQGINDYNCMIDGQIEHYRDNLRRVYDRMKRAVNTRYRNQLIAELGNYLTLDKETGEVVSSASDPRTIYYPNDYTNSNRWIGFSPINVEYGAAGLTMRPFLLGGSAIMNFANNQLATGQSGSLAPFDVFYDPRIDQDLGAGAVISFLPGTAIPLWWTDAKVGQAPKWNTSTKTRNAIDLGAVFGEPGFIVDQIIQLDDCGESFTYSFRLFTDLFFIPDAARNAVDCLQRSNLILGWEAECGEFNCNDLAVGPIFDDGGEGDNGGGE